MEGVFLFNALQAMSLLCYGWVLEKHASLAAPLILQFILGICLVGSSNSMNTLLIDIFPDRASTASAAMNLLRCILGAVSAAVVDAIMTAMGYGWAFVFMGLLVAFSSVFLFVEFKYGIKWRGRRWDRLAEKQNEKERMEERDQQQ
jgi:MFS family permease